jgi:IS6 family transposase
MIHNPSKPNTIPATFSDHSPKKRLNAMMGFKSFQTAEKTITGIEVHMLRKQQVEKTPVISDVEWINKLFGLTA